MKLRSINWANLRHAGGGRIERTNMGEVVREHLRKIGGTMKLENAPIDDLAEDLEESRAEVQRLRDGLMSLRVMLQDNRDGLPHIIEYDGNVNRHAAWQYIESVLYPTRDADHVPESRE